jgi:hypothetical protein
MALRTRGAVARIAGAALLVSLGVARPSSAQESGAGPSVSWSPLWRILGVHRYEYEERVDLSLDGSAVVDVNASLAALVALHGAKLDLDPEARLDRQAIRKLFEGPGGTITATSGFRRYGRRFVHVRLAVDDIRQVSRIAPLSWSRYSLERTGREYRFGQDVGHAQGGNTGDSHPNPAAASGSHARLPRMGPGSGAPDVGWTGDELVAFRVHLPSKIIFHNQPGGFERGNILVWEQSLRDRLTGAPLHMEARMETQSILYRTLLLFAGTFLAAMAALGIIIWWIGRKGRSMVAA